MVRSRDDDADEVPMSRPPRKPVAPPAGGDGGDVGLSFEELVAALREVEGLRDVGTGNPVFHFRSKPFLHFHDGRQGLYADVKLGTGDFEPVRAGTPAERAALLRRVERHVEKLERARKSGSGRSGKRGASRR